MTRRLTANLPLAAVLLLALALRVWGLGWGLPSATHYFSYHPDETMVLNWAMGMSLLRGDLLPHHYNYGSLQLYLVLFANTLHYLFGNGGLLTNNFNFPTQYAQWAGMYLVGRWITVGMGVGTVWAAYALGARLWGRRAGLLGALVLAITPLHAQQSHWLTVDVPATFWATLSLVWSARLAMDDPKPLRAALLAGVFAGLAAATKYNLALALLPLFAAASVRRTPPVVPLVGAAGALLAFVFACPGIILDSRAFQRDLRYEAYHVQHLPGPEFAHTGNGFVYLIARNLDAGLGLPLLLLCLASVVYAATRRTRGDGLLAAFALPYTILISLAVVRYARYTIPLLPIIALWAGRLLADVSRLPHPARRGAGLVLGAATLLLTLADAGWLVQAMAGPDPRDQALAWLDAHAPAPTPVGFTVQPWFYTPPLSPWFCAPHPGTWRGPTDPATAARIVYTRDWDMTALAQAPFLVTTSYDDTVAAAPPYAITALLTTHARAVQFVRKDLTGRVPNLPSDMAYPSPTITIYGPRP